MNDHNCNRILAKGEISGVWRVKQGFGGGTLSLHWDWRNGRRLEQYSACLKALSMQWERRDERRHILQKAESQPVHKGRDGDQELEGQESSWLWYMDDESGVRGVKPQQEEMEGLKEGDRRLGSRAFSRNCWDLWVLCLGIGSGDREKRVYGGMNNWIGGRWIRELRERERSQVRPGLLPRTLEIGKRRTMAINMFSPWNPWQSLWAAPPNGRVHGVSGAVSFIWIGLVDVAEEKRKEVGCFHK